MFEKLFLFFILLETVNGLDLVEYREKVLNKLNEIREIDNLPLFKLDPDLNWIAQSEADNFTETFPTSENVEDPQLLSDTEALKTIEKWAKDLNSKDKNGKCSSLKECQQSQNFLWKNSTKLGVGVFQHKNQLLYTVVMEPGNDTDVQVPNLVPKDSSLTVLKQKLLFLILGIVLAVLIVLIAVYLICRCRKTTGETSFDFEREPLTNPNSNQIHVIVIPRDELVMESILGEGAFGIVYSGIYKATDGKQEKFSIPVAIKCVKVDQNNSGNQSEMLEEAKIMAKLKHEHLLRLVGVAMFDGFKLITVRRSMGSLEKYLRKNREKILSEILLSYCHQISCGMSYLTKEGIIHRDLATRNVLLRNSKHVEITDFGLAKMTNKTATELTTFPAFWMSPESLKIPQKFSEYSDVWSFGVTCWEIFTYGDEPWKYMPKTLNDIIKFLEDGKRLPQSKNCTNNLHFHLWSCWQYNPLDRPKFDTLEQIFMDLTKRPNDYLSIVTVKPEISKNDDITKSLLNLVDETTENEKIPETVYIDKNNQEIVFEPIETFGSNFSTDPTKPEMELVEKKEPSLIPSESKKKLILSNFAYI